MYIRPGNKCLPALVAALQAFPRVPLPFTVRRMLICSYGFIAHAWRRNPERGTGPLLECFPRCRFLIPSTVCRSLGELTEIVVDQYDTKHRMFGSNPVFFRHNYVFISQNDNKSFMAVLAAGQILTGLSILFRTTEP